MQLNIIDMNAGHMDTTLDEVIPESSKTGDMFLLVGDPAVPGIDHCALVLVTDNKIGISGRVMFGPRKLAVQKNPTVNILGFTIRNVRAERDDAIAGVNAIRDRLAMANHREVALPGSVLNEVRAILEERMPAAKVDAGILDAAIIKMVTQ